MRMDLTRLRVGAQAVVVEVVGGKHLAGRLDAMGIVIGSTITKKSGSFLRGPVVICKGATQIAVGYAMAKKIVVDTKES